ncbi:MAG: hypothetical protein A3D10_09560 [Omnitrophica WOR_2 bacterium RIFCSPHIGHO2_02_FULL_48_11]|nr:MAG: hypothetical protein A3D10_09560 [Omnitrophica WOR_2 bacterium RIFCSPHIGHO2_02_FULL_48_11]
MGTEITKYFTLLPDDSPLKKLYEKMLCTIDPAEKKNMQETLRNSIRPGDINVNIMTKLDRTNYSPDRKELPSEYSDALAALRGYAKSSLASAIIFSAGINRRLYSYVEEFKDFYADATGSIKKKIILKVSDYRSSIIQGKFFAKKGLWISEYRIESGLNCGGHAFATDGYLMGPILEEFRIKRQELIESLHTIYNEALKLKNKLPFAKPHEMKITAQGGIGTIKEDRFLQDHYQLDGTGWATPFLLVPEVTNVDEGTRQQLAAAEEKDLYLSEVSPLGVPFNNLRMSYSDVARDDRVQKGRPGSACPKGYLVSNTEFTPQPICTASRQYQKLKIEELERLSLHPTEYQRRFNKVVQKSCICNDLAEGAMISYHLGNGALRFTAVCPGPNLAYFSKISTLQEMVDHIYGRTNLLNATYRPHMFIKELKMYVEYFMREVQKVLKQPNEKQKQYFGEFKKNLLEGIEYYRTLFPNLADESLEFRQKMLSELDEFKVKLDDYVNQNLEFFSGARLAPVPA